jgi:heme-degrading monooxygenase HmoA
VKNGSVIMDLISDEKRGLLVLVTISVRPENQQELVDTLSNTGDVSHIEGLLSRHILRSQDGTRVINHMQWASKEAYEEAAKHLPAFTNQRTEVHRLMESITSAIYELGDPS